MYGKSKPSDRGPHNYLLLSLYWFWFYCWKHCKVGELMPLYQYTCEDCGNGFELFQMMKDRDHPTLQACTSCLNGKVIRVIANTSFRLGTQGKVGWASSGYGENVLGNEATYKNRGF